MKIKLDENLPFRLIEILSELGHEIDTIPQEGLKGCNVMSKFGKQHKDQDVFSSLKI